MDNEIEVFSSEEFGSIRTFRIVGEPWFAASDVCAALELSNRSMAVERLDSPGGNRTAQRHRQARQSAFWLNTAAHEEVMHHERKKHKAPLYQSGAGA